MVDESGVMTWFFFFEKYELIHLSHKTKRFNMRATMKINDVAVESKSNMRVLKLQINIKLKWLFHMKTIKIKMIIQCMTLFKIMTFTWKIFFVKIKQIYLMIIYLIMIYVLTIWHEFINKLQTKTKRRLRNSNRSQQIKTNCDKVARRLRDAKKWPIRQNFISKQKKMIWTKKLTQKC